MFRVLYLVLSYLCPPFVFAFLLVRGIGDPTYRSRKRERFGLVPREIAENCIWFHAVSAGEAIATTRIVDQLLAEDLNLPILVTTTTPMGSREVLTRLGDRVDHCYAPYDTPGSVARFLRRIKPRMLLLMETELWAASCEKDTLNWCTRLPYQCTTIGKVTKRLRKTEGSHEVNA